MIDQALHVLTPVVLAGLGGLFSALAGVLNIGLEGMILAGAFASIVTLHLSGSYLLAIVAAASAGVVLALIVTLSAIRLRANIFLTGLGVNLLAAGVIPFASSALFGVKGVLRLENVTPLPRLAPGLLGGQTALLYLALALVALAHLTLYQTPFGLRLRTAGSAPGLLTERGLSVDRYRRYALWISGVGAGMAGGALALRLGVYLPNISAGRGWIALVTIFLGYRKPLGVLLAGLLITLTESLANNAQGTLEIPNTLLLSLPYLLTLIAMILYSAVRRLQR
ncbi:MAG: ABC transporter permease subunit [Alkalispirochaetaceae bacterium]